MSRKYPHFFIRSPRLLCETTYPIGLLICAYGPIFFSGYCDVSWRSTLLRPQQRPPLGIPAGASSRIRGSQYPPLPAREPRLVTSKPLSPLFLSSLSTLTRFVRRHLYIVDCTCTLFAIYSPDRPTCIPSPALSSIRPIFQRSLRLGLPIPLHYAHVPRLLYDYCRIRFFSCLTPSRIVHSPIKLWTHTHAVPPSHDTLPPSGVRCQHNVCSSIHVLSTSFFHLTPSRLFTRRLRVTSGRRPRRPPVMHSCTTCSIPLSRHLCVTSGPKPRLPLVKHSFTTFLHGICLLHLPRTLVHTMQTYLTLYTSTVILPFLSPQDYVRALHFLVHLAKLSLLCQFLFLAMSLLNSCYTPALVIPLMEYFYYHPP